MVCCEVAAVAAALLLLLHRRERSEQRLSGDIAEESGGIKKVSGLHAQRLHVDCTHTIKESTATNTTLIHLIHGSKRSMRAGIMVEGRGGREGGASDEAERGDGQ